MLVFVLLAPKQNVIWICNFCSDEVDLCLFDWMVTMMSISTLSRHTKRHTANFYTFIFCFSFVWWWRRVPFDVDIFQCGEWVSSCRGERLHIGNCHHKICLLSRHWQFNLMLLWLLEMPSFILFICIFLEALLPSSSSLVSFRHYFYSWHRLSHHFCARTERNESGREKKK